jgi:hypothetical protein
MVIDGIAAVINFGQLGSGRPPIVLTGVVGTVLRFK